MLYSSLSKSQFSLDLPEKPGLLTEFAVCSSVGLDNNKNDLIQYLNNEIVVNLIMPEHWWGQNTKYIMLLQPYRIFCCKMIFVYHWHATW